LKTDVKLSDCRKYRFALWRLWDESKPYAMFIGLNPSTADETTNDPTITRCINFAKSLGIRRIMYGNLFAYRSTDPSGMMATEDPVGEANDEWLLILAKDAGVVAWGNDGAFLDRSKQVKKLLSNLHYLKLNQSGEPSHPLYLKSDLLPIPINP
jgi:hypothetical protein